MERLARCFCALSLAVFFAVGALFGEEITVCSLNCRLLFDPAIDHPGRVDSENPLFASEYESKVENLAQMLAGADFAAVQEVGGKTEIAAVAAKARLNWRFTPGGDTYTGQNVGLLVRASRSTIASGRVAELDRLLSKHLHVVTTVANRRVHFLAVHLIRPIGENAAKHRRQLEAIGDWINSVRREEPDSVVIVLGDTNSRERPANGSLFGVGTDALLAAGWPATHVDGACYDRIVVAGPARVTKCSTVRPAYGPRPNKQALALWTDHFLVRAVIDVEEGR